MQQEMALFFKRFEIDLMEMWDDESNAINHNLPKKKPLVPQQQGSMKCTYHDVELVSVPYSLTKRP